MTTTHPGSPAHLGSPARPGSPAHLGSPARPGSPARKPTQAASVCAERFRLTRAGVLNVWQYDEQVFEFADGRLLLRGANGAGKSKTMEMLLPFVIDGDKGRLTASGRHHTSLLWLMLDGYEGAGRTGYVWVEFTRGTDDGDVETVTCGVGLRATASARAATAWFFTSPRRVGIDLILENDSGPLGQAALAAALDAVDGPAAHVFDSPSRYREHIGQLLFGLPLDQYESLLRLIYWLRQPQVGEDIDPRRLAEQLVNALPVVDPETLTQAGKTFDELQAFGEEIDRRERSSTALAEFVAVYGGYARSVLAERGRAALDAEQALRAARRRLKGTERTLAEVRDRLGDATRAHAAAESAGREARTRIVTLESSPQARSRQHLVELGKRVGALADTHSLAQRDTERSQGRAESSAAQAGSSSRRVLTQAQKLNAACSEATARLEQCGAGAVPAPGAAARLARPPWEPPADLPGTAGEIDTVAEMHRRWADDAAPAVGAVLAAVKIVEDSRVTAEQARDRAERAQHTVDGAETRAASARDALTAARRETQEAETSLLGQLRAWLEGEGAVAFDLPELTADGLALLEGLAREAAAPHVESANTGLAEARQRLLAARTEITELTAQRRIVEAETDPAPLAPTWRRDSRQERPGAPFWRLVDFRPGLDARERAGLEAALEGAGLLDAWVDPDGRLHDADRDDVTLVASPAVTSPPVTSPPVASASVVSPPVASASVDPAPAAESGSGPRGLGTLLAPDPAATDVDRAVVARLLTMIGLCGDDVAAQATSTGEGGEGDPSGPPVAVAPDGRWRAGPAHGQTGKPAAQYIGASARAAERARRVAELDARLERARVDEATAAAQTDEFAARLAALTAWLDTRPRHDAVLAAWSREEARSEAVTAAETELAAAAQAARAARDEAAARHTALVSLAEQHRLPITADGLAARAEQAREAGRALDTVTHACAALADAAHEWLARAEQARADAEELAERRARQDRAHESWQTARAEHEELTQAQGADIAELEQRLAEYRAAARDADAAATRHTRAREELIGTEGGLARQVDTDRDDLTAAQPHRDEAVEALRGLYAVPGLVTAAAIEADPAQPPAELAGIREITERALAGSHSSVNAVLQAIAGLQSGPASVTEPRLVDVAGAYAAVGRDDITGDVPLPELAASLATSVAADRLLLTDRERTLFETHILGQLGDALRAVRRQAEELVAAMNGQLEAVTTSQGIRVRLRWRLREDIPADARRAVELLGQPLGALLADERAELREALHRLIDISRAEAPEEAYTEHLTRALDYRQWFAFTVQYHRPEAGDWRDLQRKSALSQGEQKVLCYLPLFAAAAAHFTSLAGAAPHAPRFVLLDDAFPKIDARTHPLLFGLLVDLDLDFVVTSERLWGTHATVPALAIYEALRNPAQRGIAQYEHRWDGHQLTAVGAGG